MRAQAAVELALVHGDFKANNLVWDGVERFEDCGSVYAVRHLPITFTPGPRVKAG